MTQDGTEEIAPRTTATEGGGTAEKANIKDEMFEVAAEPPKWLTQDYFENILKGHERDPELKVRDRH